MSALPASRELDASRVAQAPLRAPSTNGGLLDVFRRRFLLRLLVRKEIQARYSGSLLGLMWSYVMPLFRFVMYYFVIGLVLQLHKNVPNFAIHLFAGLVFAHFFTETINASTRSILRNKALVQKLPLPREMFPMSSLFVSAIHGFPQLVIAVVAAVAVGWHGDLTAVSAGVLGLVILLLFSAGFALVFSAFNVHFRDFGQAVAIITLMTHWLVPMMYPFSRLDGAIGGTWLEKLYLANPLAEAVLLLQRGLWAPTCPGQAACTGPHAMPADLFERAFIMVVAGAAFLVVCQWVFTRMEATFAERLVA